MAEKKKKKHLLIKILKKIFDIGIFVLTVLVLTYLVSAFVVQRIVVHNVSMQPTLTEGDILLMDKISYKVREPKRYEIICFNSDYEREGLIKRVIGLPGETIMISNGMIFINGTQLDDYEGLEKIETPGLAAEEITLGSDEYFVIGDNRERSIDSRSEEIGNVRSKDIIGRAFMRLSPFDNFGFLK